MRCWVLLLIMLAGCTTETVGEPVPHCEAGEPLALCTDDERARCGPEPATCDSAGEAVCVGSTLPPLCTGQPTYCVICDPGPDGVTLRCAERCTEMGTIGEGFDDTGEWSPTCVAAGAPEDQQDLLYDTPRCIFDPTGRRLPTCGTTRTGGFALNDPAYMRCQRL